MSEPLFSPSASSGRSGAGGRLPIWPVYLLFAGFPVFWLLGLGSFVPVICAVPMLALLAVRRKVHLPLGFVFWALFVVWAGIAVLELDSALRIVGYAVRMSNYLGASVVFVYVYNLDPARVPPRRVLLPLLAFFGVVVAGGWLGVLLPGVHLNTPVSALLPTSVSQNSYVSALVRPTFAEVQQPYGAPHAFSRPSAPFAYTNSWGCNVALLVPAVLALLFALPRSARGLRIAGLALLALGLVPALATLNRGMFLAIGAGMTYAALRFALRGRLVPLAGVVTAATVGLGVALASGVGTALQQRLRYSDTNASRTEIYAEAFRGALASPLFGNGGPRPSDTLDVSVGTQGQIWNVMFSYGFVGLFFFLAWFGWVALASRRWATPADLWVHVGLVVAVLTVFYYGYDGPQLTVAMVLGAVALRRSRPAPSPTPQEPPIEDAEGSRPVGVVPPPARIPRPAVAPGPAVAAGRPR